MKGSCRAQNQLDSFIRFDRTPSDGQADTTDTGPWLVPAPQIRSHDFWRYINLYVYMYVCTYVARVKKSTNMPLHVRPYARFSRLFHYQIQR